jgi:two-component system response regulator AtoC
MPGIDGLSLLAQVGEKSPETPVVLMTAHGSVPLAVEAMKAGAADFVLKPFDREEILFTVRKALAQTPAREVPATSRASWVSRSKAMEEVEGLLRKAAGGIATVLVRGESGTGKELAARSLHQMSPRRDGPFVKVHCAALPDTLLESELFGYEKGAFTGAASRKPGRVELAQGGTLFLDEIGDITPATQVKLLRLLQDREFELLGSSQPRKADVRFVAATHQPLEQRVREGTFREDLFYRLNVVPVWMPALRERPEDIEPLAKHFCEEAAKLHGGAKVALEGSAVVRLKKEPWPGNVRQLQNFVERLVVLSDGQVVTEADVERELSRGGLHDARPAGEGSAESLDDHRRSAEKAALIEALNKAKNNRTLAARLLGISRRTLYNKLEEHGLMGG